MKRFLLLLLLPLLLLTAPPATAQDEEGGGFLERLIEDSLSGEGFQVSITGFQGALSSQASLERLTIADQTGVWLTLENAVLDWQRSALLRGRLEVNELSAERLVIDRLPEGEATPPSPEARGFSLPDLPVSVNIGRLAIERAELGAPILGEAVALSLEGSAQLAGGEGTVDLAVDRLDGTAGSLRLAGSYGNASRQLSLDVALEEGQGGLISRLAGLPGAPALALTLQGEGVIDDFAADLQLATNGEDRFGGTITLQGSEENGHRFAADLTGDLRPLLPPGQTELLGATQSLQVQGLRGSDGRLSLDVLELDTAQVRLSGQARIAADGWPELLQLDGQIAAQDGSPVQLVTEAGDTRLDRATLTLDFDAAQGDALVLDVIAEGLDRPDLTLERAALTGRGSLSRTEGSSSPGGVTLDLDLDVSGLEFTDADLAGAAGDALAGSLAIDWQAGEPLYLRDLDLTGAGLALRGDVTVSGIEGDTLTVTPDLQLDAANIARFSGLVGRDLAGAVDVALSGDLQPLAGGFDLTADGTAQDLAVGIPQLDGLMRGAITLRAAVARDETGTVLRDLAIDGQSVQLTADATLQTDASTGRFDITLADLAQVQEGLSGPATLRGTLEETAARYAIDFTATGPGGSEAAGLLTAGKTEAGSITELGFDGTASAERLAAFAPLAGRDIAGAARFDGQARYTLDGGALLAEGRLDTEDLAVGIEAVDRIIGGTGLALVDLDRNAEGLLTLRRAEISTQGLEATATGSFGAPGSTLEFTATVADVGLDAPARLSGTLAEAETQYRLDFDGEGPGAANAQGLVTVEKLSDGSLGRVAFDGAAGVDRLAAYRPLTGQPLAGGVSFDGQASYNIPDGSLSAQGNLTTRDLAAGIAAVDRLIGGSGRAVVDVTRDAQGMLSIRQLEVQTPEITATASGSLGAAGTAITYDVALRDLGLFVPQLPGRATAQGQLSSQGSGPWQVSGDLTAPGGTQARVSGSVAQSFGSADLGITGQVPLALANRLLEPNLIDGLARLDLQLNGPLALSSLSGTVTVNGGSVVLPGPALSLTGVDVTANLGGGQVRLDAGGALSSGGRVSASGTIGMTAPYTADLAVALDSLVLQDRRLYQAQAGGRLTVTGPLLTGPRVAGVVDIEQAEIRIPETGLGPGSRSFVLTHIQEPAAARETRARAGLLEQARARSGPAYVLPLDITIRAPSRIFIRGRGLDAELGGQLRLSGTSANIVPEGRFDLIRGRLDILGQRLTLDRAGLSLTGDFVPTLDVAATSEREGTTITVTITGEATSPEVDFSSDPPRPEEEVLALLLFGQDVQNISAFQALRLASAVNTLAGRGGSGIVDNLRMGFGLDDLDVTTDEDGNAGLRLGKYISDNVYTDVEVDSGGDSSVNLNIQISPSVKARGSVTSDGDTGVGVFFERDY
ncbi:translocation/assembly module TamB domain-containing protein [Salipiger manganoxidans]|uniref:translocation/assembly module TamB domain-containing protein n=1 Tax=Salipiger marinus TaxID=555512 RepID=UPI001E39EBA3|nr:translocation/assembly module TamB domain-containing protein [Salipiger manganoxidans]MCD1617634.1 translocation/assembly module TamB domain-containing protein [Salipiger manganoxidans]